MDTSYRMKKYIFNVIVLFLGALIGTSGCKKEHPSMTQGVIVGWNLGSCVTCGGFYLNMSNDTARGSATYYVLNWPLAADSLIDQDATQYNKNHLPIYVSFDWQPVGVTSPPDAANWIRVTAIQSR
jgi:hypothetical protein